MYGPGAKYGRLLYEMTSVPAWGAANLSHSRRTVWTARAGLVVPILVVMFQVRRAVGLPRAY